MYDEDSAEVTEESSESGGEQVDVVETETASDEYGAELVDSNSSKDGDSELADRTGESGKESSEYESDLIGTRETVGAAEAIDAGEESEKEEASGEAESEKSETEDGDGEDNTSDAERAEAERAEIEENSEYSSEINDWISSKEELEVYQNAGLKERTVDGRACLVRESIDPNYVDPKAGKSNQELMEMGRSPYDAKTGERIELHHIGQEYDSPLAELTADSEHGSFTSTLHTKEDDSWRHDEEKNKDYNTVQRPDHWKARAKEG